MIGKKNIVFGLFYLLLTAALGPYMIVKHFDYAAATEGIKQEKVGALQQIVANEYELDFEAMSASQIAKTNSQAILALSGRINAQAPINAIKGGPHAHGNLEALLNVVIGILLCFLAAARVIKQVISWLFIIGTIGHSGLLYLAIGVNLGWAQGLLATPLAYVGPLAILLGLAVTAVVAVLSFRGTLETDF